MTIKHSTLNTLSLFYIYLPILIFLFGWCKWYVAIPCTAVSVYVLYGMLKAYNVDSGSVRINKYALAFSILFMLVAAYYLGWGRFTTQMNDYGKHNGVLNDLILRSWPVVYKEADGHLCMLTYYLGQYLVPAFMGKLFSSYRIAELTMATWSFIGLLLVYFHLLRVLKGEGMIRPIVIVMALILFSPPLAVAKSIIFRAYDGLDFAGEWFWYSDNLKLQYSSNWGLLQWVFPQAIVPWLTTMLFMEYVRKVEYYVPLLLPALFYSAFSFLGILPFAFIAAIYYFLKEENKRRYFQSIFSLHNIATTCSIGIVMILYLWGNVAEPKPSEIGFRIMDYSQRPILLPFFWTVMVLLYAVLIYKENKKNPWYWVTVGCLLLYPLFSMGLMNDLVMRCSIPALFIMMCLILWFILDKQWEASHNGRYRVCILIAILLFSTKWPLRSLQDQIREDNISTLAEDKSYVTMEQFTNRADLSVRVDRRYNYFTHDITHSLFYRYLSREPHYNTQLHLTPVLPYDQRHNPTIQ